MTSCYVIIEVTESPIDPGTGGTVEMPVQVCTTIGAAYAFKDSLEREKRAGVLYYEIIEVPLHCPEITELEDKLDRAYDELTYMGDW